MHTFRKSLIDRIIIFYELVSNLWYSTVHNSSVGCSHIGIETSLYGDPEMPVKSGNHACLLEELKINPSICQQKCCKHALFGDSLILLVLGYYRLIAVVSHFCCVNSLDS